MSFEDSLQSEVKMQRNNNFEAIISTWRRMSAEQGESVVSMSGDSPDYQLHKNKDEETNHLIPDKVKPIVAAASAGTASIILEDPPALPADNEKQPLDHDKEESKDAAGDGNVSLKEDPDYLDNKDLVNKPPEITPKSTDKVDSIFITPSVIKSPPTQSASSNPDDDDCIIKCLYYTLQCCDCVIM